jgi:hypothetical protein
LIQGEAGADQHRGVAREGLRIAGDAHRQPDARAGDFAHLFQRTRPRRVEHHRVELLHLVRQQGTAEQVTRLRLDGLKPRSAGPPGGERGDGGGRAIQRQNA